MTPGEKIQKLRKQKRFSQETLAERVSVTRQTISKWELGQSAPDLENVAQLCDIFNVSADYLIKEEFVESDALPTKKKKLPHLSERTKLHIFATVSAAALTAICVCMICDYFTSKCLLWSLVAAASIVAAWCLCVPAFTVKTKIVLKTLLIASAIPIPFLALLGLLLERPIVFTLGSCIAIVAIVAVWSIYGVLRKCRKHLWRGLGFAMLIVIPAVISINHLSAYFVLGERADFTSDLFNGAITLVLAVVCFGIDYLRYCKNGENGEKV